MQQRRQIGESVLMSRGVFVLTVQPKRLDIFSPDDVDARRAWNWMGSFFSFSTHIHTHTQDKSVHTHTHLRAEGVGHDDML